jgi:hypothetical protein
VAVGKCHNVVIPDYVHLPTEAVHAAIALAIPAHLHSTLNCSFGRLETSNSALEVILGALMMLPDCSSTACSCIHACRRMCCCVGRTTASDGAFLWSFEKALPTEYRPVNLHHLYPGTQSIWCKHSNGLLTCSAYETTDHLRNKIATQRQDVLSLDASAVAGQHSACEAENTGLLLMLLLLLPLPQSAKHS